MADKDEIKKPSEQDSKGSKNYLLAAVLFFNTVLMGAVAFLQYQSHTQKAQESTIKDVVKAAMLEKEVDDKARAEGLGEAEKTDGILYPLKTFTANLAQGDGPRRFLRMTAVIQFSQDTKKSEVEARSPQIRDKIISLINSKRPEDLLKVEGKAYLKEEIKAAINALMVDGHVMNVYYVEFQIN
ncbi:MAG: hypothetical protein A2381_12855 [Bdellovibrionales bacterium RIFOXYB1_FULL_37_110]|nr:MAG: hypothetical protein A2181_02180 [Bdellovibrionales bacterium RIFOXYA1_FULL_38_20]OFZ51596.1 MAG: hypothetical protein A2417_12515 [Bdellovibrionales bacterium RIFOXYC1_FULL_37_79]OFZ60423.1 MAG: hypothetical protein A2381_12855 [Bdellovibrionales bacterium RIFOXYB1_FULL_37_110]OFZ64996.1 MAG: hypothetical protein A2577_09120 [Bdellovibrionales bacterium RIFOXYD1_FULL_36_51]